MVELVMVARKPHRCSWCAEGIDAGTSYTRWRHFGDSGPTIVKMHPECVKANEDMRREDQTFDEWIEGDNPRGCICGHDPGCSFCNEKKRLKLEGSK